MNNLMKILEFQIGLRKLIFDDLEQKQLIEENIAKNMN